MGLSLSAAPAWLGLIAACVGGYAGLLEYEQQNDKTLDEASMNAINFVLRFQDPEFMRIREAVTGYIFEGGAAPNFTELSAYVEFFDAVYVCVENNLCDVEVVNASLQTYALGHWPCLAPDVLAVRAREVSAGLPDSYGRGLEHFAGATPAAQGGAQEAEGGSASLQTDCANQKAGSLRSTATDVETVRSHKETRL